MRFDFIGTGAADWDWSNPASRGSTCTLIDGRILIDAGPSVLAKMAAAGLTPAGIADIFITHSHPDHFNPENIAAIAEQAAQTVRIYTTPQALDRIPASAKLEKHALTWGAAVQTGSLSFRALPSNHSVDDIAEDTFHFLIHGEGKRVLYALDGAWICGRAKRMMAQDGGPLDLVIWDATCGGTLCNRRFAEHNDLEMIRMLRASMLDAGLITDGTKHIFDHLSRMLWPADPRDLSALAREYDGITAEDGTAFFL